jgi:molybdopterin-guanine dinucleotide biosynthesis protein A
MRWSAVLLAGGKSSRMGRDKTQLEVQGEPLLTHQIETLRRLSPEQLFLSGPLSDPRCETIADELAGAGPLAGIALALRKCSSSHLVVLAIDLPMMTTVFLRSLLHLCREQKGVVPRRDQRFEPLAAVYPKSSAPLAAAALQNGDFSLQSFVQAGVSQDLLLVRKISDDEAPLFTNLNTPADLAAL